MSLYAWFEVRTNYIEIKFNEILNASSITNNKFAVYNATTATPVSIANPFKPIDVSRDYYSISRTLHLWWNFELQSNTTYQVVITNLLNIEGATPAQVTIEFETGIIEYGLQDELEPPSRHPIDVEDYSIKVVSDFIYSSLSSDVDKLKIEKIVPGSDKAYYLDPTENEGKIEIWFNQAPAANYINSSYFKVQRKLVSRNISRWEDINARITANTAKGAVFIYLPSLDATPVFAYEVDKAEKHEYFQPEYKYRVIISKDIGI